MACKFPAFCFHGIGNLLRPFPFLFQAEIRMCIEPLYFIFVQICRAGFITLICTVSQDSVISGECHDSLGTTVGKIRMLLHKTVDQRNHIVITYRHTSIIFHIFVADLPFFIHNQFCGKSISIHVMIITHVIL